MASGIGTKMELLWWPCRGKNCTWKELTIMLTCAMMAFSRSYASCKVEQQQFEGFERNVVVSGQRMRAWHRRVRQDCCWKPLQT